jgi:diguanylate cyclase (GGDEF)-like protein
MPDPSISNHSVTDKGNILIVDDVPENLHLLSKLLQARSYKVRSVTSGAMALRTAKAKPPDIILLDIRMPEMDGYEVCQLLKQHPTTRDVPVIFISALGEMLDKVKAFRAGGIDYISKPFEPEEVYLRIETQLMLQRQHRRLQQEIEQRERIQTNLKQSQELLAGVLNSSLDGIMAYRAIRDDAGTIADFEWLIVNPIAAHLTGQSPEDLVGKRLLQEYPALVKTELFKRYRAVVQTGKPLEQEYYFENDILKAWFHLVAVKLGDGVAVTLRDITQRKQMELNLRLINEELAGQVNVDSLTQIANRRCFDRGLTSAWLRCAQNQQPLSLILCDIDYFKQYNDTYGHVAGDDCLTLVAQAVTQAVMRPTDLVARYGGEEFAVMLPNTHEAGAIHVAERIRAEVRRLNLPHATSLIAESLTLSLGISSHLPDYNGSPKLLIAAADQALYEAKQQGRNCYCKTTVPFMVSSYTSQRKERG